MGRWLMLLLGILMVLMVAVGWRLGPGLKGQFVPGVWVWDISLAWMTPSEMQVHLEAALPLHQPDVVLVGPEGERWAFSPSDLGMAVDTQATLTRAYRIGHTETGAAALWERLQVIWHGVVLPPVLAWDAVAAQQQLQMVAEALNRPPENARIVSEGASLHLASGEIGRRMDVTATLALLEPHLHSLTPTEIVPVLHEQAPQVTDEEAARALNVANAILNEPLTLLFSDPQAGDVGPWTLSPEVMASMLRVRTEADEVSIALEDAALREFLGPVAMAVHRDPVDAHFSFDTELRDVTPISPSVTGRELDIEATISQIQARLRNGEHFVPLVVNVIPPDYPDTLTAADLGITEVAAVGESYFTGSSSARDKNIRLGASQFDGVLVPPGETFSFNEHLGDVTLEKGYDESYVIIGDRTVPGVGGGICQVATTMFRAAYYGGFPIVERWPHAYRVSYYELGGYGPGFDATVYSPLVDFRFVNDTPHHLLIKPQVDGASARLRFVIYGTKDGRTVEQIGPEWGEPNPPETSVYEYDPDLPAGSVRQVETAHNGLRATLGRVVHDADGNVMYRDTFVSDFVPWPARYLYGPGYDPPADAEVIRPEEEGEG